MKQGQPELLEPRGQPPARPTWGVDAVIVAVLLAGWLVGLAGPVLRLRPIGYDTYRDSAYAEHILAGRWTDDPALLGYSYWYPPLGPTVYALVSRLTGLPALAVYGTGVLWVNIWILPLVYLLVRRTFDPLAGLGAVLCVWLGSRWWSESLALPLPAVQGLVPALAALWLWVEVQRGRAFWAVPVGLMLGVCVWHHVICGMVAAGAIGLHAVIAAVVASPGRRRQPLLRVAIAAAVCGAVVAPLAWHLAALPHLNRVPTQYAPATLFNPGYFRQADTLLVILLAAAGLIYVWRKSIPKGGWVVGYLLVGMIGQAPVYLQRFVAPWLGRSLPVLVPHEFQWHGQLAVGVLAGVAAAWLARGAVSYGGPRLAGSTGFPSRLAVWYAWACIMLLTVGLNAAAALRRTDDRWLPSTPAAADAEAARWIKQNTSVCDVFLCHPRVGYEVVGALTGRKLVALPPGWANVAAPMKQLHDDAQHLLDTTDPAEFLRLAARHHVRYIYADPTLHDHLPRWRSWGLFDEPFASTDGQVQILRLSGSSQSGGGSLH